MYSVCSYETSEKDASQMYRRIHFELNAVSDQLYKFVKPENQSKMEME